MLLVLIEEFGNTALQTLKLADFSYQNDEIAAMIVTAWTNATFRNGLLQGSIATRKTNAQNALAALANPIGLTSAIVLSEAEYDAGWEADDDNEVVFVLPNPPRQTGNHLETAKLLMACVPNGI